MRRTIIVGDVHGCFEELENLLVKAKYDQYQDRLVFLGDLVDRGPHSGKCVKLARELRAESVLGNHEEKHIRWRKHEERRLEEPNYQNPIKHFNEDKLRVQSQLDPEDMEFIRAMPTTLPLGSLGGREWLAVHAGIEPGLPLEKQEKNHLVRLRWVDDDGLYRPYDSDDQGRSVLGRPKDTRYWADVWSGPYNVVYGHAVHSLVDPRITVNDGVTTVGLDTGCCFGGRLTALLLPSFDFVQVQARRTYWSMPDVAWAE